MPQGDALKVAVAPSWDSRQVKGRMTEWKRKVRRQKEGCQIWASYEGGDKLTSRKKKKRKRQELKKVRMTAQLYYGSKTSHDEAVRG